MQTQHDKLKVCNCENNQVNILNDWSNDKRQEVLAVNSFNQKPKLYLRELSYTTSTSWSNLKPFVNKWSVNQQESVLFISPDLKKFFPLEKKLLLQLKKPKLSDTDAMWLKDPVMSYYV